MDSEETTEVSLSEIIAVSETVSADKSVDELLPPAAGDSIESVRGSGRWWLVVAALAIALLALASGLGIGYLTWSGSDDVISVMPVAQAVTLDPAALGERAEAEASVPAARPTQGPALPPVQHVVQLPESYTLPIRYGMLGPQLVAAGVIDLPAFVGLYAANGNPLSAAQQAIVSEGSQAPVVIDQANAHFLLNFFWAVGLANQNAILLEGEMQQSGTDQIDQFASTGGWTLASKPIKELVASLPLVELTAVQQARLQAVAESVYRPCCGNSTAFPDCNHGMAMLGVLELMAAGDASEEQMFEAAKYLNAFWFPEQMAEAAAYFKLTLNQEFEAIDPRRIVGRDIFSSSGAQSVHEWLANAGRLGEPAEGGGSCGV